MSSRYSKIRIAILDDHPIVLYGISLRLSEEPDFILVGSFDSSHAMISTLQNTPADVLLIDFSLGPTEMDGVSLIRILKVKFPESKMLILSSYYDPPTVRLALTVGAWGFVSKGVDVSQVISAIRRVADGSVYLDPDMSFRLAEPSLLATLESCPKNNKSAPKLLVDAKLSAREREVIRCFLDGMTVNDIASKFNRSAKTISTQKNTAFRKLGVSSNNELFKIKYMLEEL